MFGGGSEGSDCKNPEGGAGLLFDLVMESDVLLDGKAGLAGKGGLERSG